MTEHSNIIGGSSADRRILCYGSYQAEQGYPDKETEYAAEGTACHLAMEDILLEDLVPEDLVGRTYNAGNAVVPEGFTITDDEDGLLYRKIVPAFEAWQEILNKYGEIDFTVEARCDLSEIIEGAFGTVDVLGQLVSEPSTKIVLDWKFGSQSVSAYANYQCGFYASAARHTKTDPDIMEIMEGAEKIIFIVVQPDTDGTSYWSDWETDVKWLDMYLELATVAVERAKDENPPRTPGNHCKWCKAKADCEAQKAEALAALEVDPLKTTAVERAYWLGKAEQLSAWVSAVRKAAHEDIERGVGVPGWKLVDKRAQRKFTADDDELARVLGGVLGPDNIYQEPKLKSPAQVESTMRADWQKKVKAKELVDGKPAKRGGWTAIYESLIAPLVEKKSSGTKLAPATDAAPSATINANRLAEALEKAKPGKHGGH